MGNLGYAIKGILGSKASLGGGSGIYTPNGGFVGLLDSYPIGVGEAYSLRKLSASHVNAIEVRRSSDNTQTTIGFVGEELDTTALLDFVGVSDGFVSTWYTASNSGNNATNALAASQPQIVSGGSLITTNGKPSLNFQADDFLLFTNVTPLTTFTVAKLDVLSLLNYILYDLVANKGYIYGGSLAGANGIGVFDGATKTIAGEDLNQHLGYFNYASTLFQIARDGGAATDLAAGSNIPLTQIGRSASNLSFNGKVQEAIMYPTSQSANKVPIETNIKTFYSIP